MNTIIRPKFDNATAVEFFMNRIVLPLKVTYLFGQKLLKTYSKEYSIRKIVSRFEKYLFSIRIFACFNLKIADMGEYPIPNLVTPKYIFF